MLKNPKITNRKKCNFLLKQKCEYCAKKKTIYIGALKVSILVIYVMYQKLVPFGPHDLLNDQSTFRSPPTRFDHPVTM